MEAGDIFRKHCERNTVSLFKGFLMILEDLRKEHEIHFNKLKRILNKDIDCDFLPIRSFEGSSCKLNINKAEKNLKFKASIKLEEVIPKMLSNRL